MLLDGELMSVDDFGNWLAARKLFGDEEVKMTVRDKTGDISLEIMVHNGKGKNVKRYYFTITGLTPSTRERVLVLADVEYISYGLAGKSVKKLATVSTESKRKSNTKVSATKSKRK